MERREYNGWTNYETWLLNLWMDNDGLSETYREQAADMLTDAIEADKPDPIKAVVVALADSIKDDFESMAEEILDAAKLSASFWADLLNAGLSEVDWREVSEHCCDDLEVWTAGSNMPGYMPDEPPAHFADHDDAVSYLVDEIKRDADERDDDDLADDHREAVAEIEASKGEVTVMFAGRAYFIGRL